jgi:hypothetical protein
MASYCSSVGAYLLSATGVIIAFFCAASNHKSFLFNVEWRSDISAATASPSVVGCNPDKIVGFLLKQTVFSRFCRRITLVKSN